ncbi:hypothetical protein AJ78_00879 [Emergomyces pasteurianus Ep9510]|uniref:Uncharacterized protein n=1 Tax=Emergomyces pasteurianus Ep9510 TaxID=1447872 RepID=A0A1J9PRY4_9EURO|nr:hypothetical protein AJ78_00879 [Emergomyces pasteurianus Ep9510]
MSATGAKELNHHQSTLEEEGLESHRGELASADTKTTTDRSPLSLSSSASSSPQVVGFLLTPSPSGMTSLCQIGRHSDPCKQPPTTHLEGIQGSPKLTVANDPFDRVGELITAAAIIEKSAKMYFMFSEEL